MSEEDELQKLMQNYGDGLPVVPPTKGRVLAMLSTLVDRRPDEVLGKLPPSYHDVTIEKVAANAVLAGCKPMHLSVVVAAVEAMLDPQHNIHGAAATTMGATPLVIVNGPVRDDIGLNCAGGCLGSGTNANATICRALKLLLQNVGRAKLGGTESTTLGSPFKYGTCFGEREGRCSPWNPLHVERGFAADESVVTVVSVTSGPHQVVDFYTRDADTLVALIAKAMHGAYNPYFPLVNECVVVISPEHQATLVAGGITTKEELRQRLWRHCNKDLAPSLRRIVVSQKNNPIGQIVGGGLGLAARLVNLVGGHGLPFVPKFSSPDSFYVVVAGADAGKFSCFMPGFGIGKPPMPTAGLSMAVSKRVGRSQPATAFESSGELVSPCGDQQATPFSLTPRLGKAEALRAPGCTVGLLDISKPRGSEVLDIIAAELAKINPSLTLKRYKKPTFSRPAPPSLLDEVAAECAFVVTALAD
mmetsp:Transcript_65551/g.143060  ORF Transcript_65551/g.143060 Transcript_65551/m.143060 type:complete len:473 (+) Transcript_65551:47-1465(+)